MEIIKTFIEDLVILQPSVFEDERGYFIEAFKESFFEDHYPNLKFIQDNESKSTYGVLRGLHFQKPPFEQTKLVRVIQGKVLDVAVDLRPNSKTFGKHESVILSEENKQQFLIPKGFAHGFIVLSEEAVFSYKVDNYYAPNYDSGIIFNDSDININWQIDLKEVIVSSKDSKLVTFNQFQRDSNSGNSNSE